MAITPRQQYLNDVAKERGEPEPFHEMDDEATQFAAALLIPRAAIEADLEKVGAPDIDDDKWLEGLAKRYRVSSGLMRYRLWQLARGTSEGDRT